MCLFLFSDFAATPSGSQGLLLAHHSGITSSGCWGSEGMLGIKYGAAECKPNALHAVILLWYQFKKTYVHLYSLWHLAKWPTYGNNLGTMTCKWICTIEYYSATKNYQVIPFRVTSMEVKDTMLNKVCEKDNVKQWIFSKLWSIDGIVNIKARQNASSRLQKNSKERKMERGSKKRRYEYNIGIKYHWFCLWYRQSVVFKLLVSNTTIISTGHKLQNLKWKIYLSRSQISEWDWIWGYGGEIKNKSIKYPWIYYRHL